ncbi:MAG: hypothetical protein WC809_00610 [Sinimarinibacterium sp.]|jgi:hypothetical protein
MSTRKSSALVPELALAASLVASGSGTVLAARPHADEAALIASHLATFDDLDCNVFSKPAAASTRNKS